MTIAEIEREVKSVIDKHSVYGLESVLFAVVRGSEGKPYMSKEEVIALLLQCYKHVEEWGE